MGRPNASFPQSIWDGSTASREINDTRDPDPLDWDRIVSELIAVQQYTQTASFTGVASGTIHQHRCIVVGDYLRHATSNDGVVHGFSLSSGGPGDTIEYITVGRVSLTLPEGVYFLRDDGQISLTPPNTGYVVKIGTALPAAFDFRPLDSIRI